MAKEYRELCFTDNFMFCKVVGNNEELCRHMLELILGKSIRKVEINTAEKVIDLTPEAKSIRMDVYLDDDENTVYDLEMQTSAKKNLPKRLRYYQGVIDLNLIEKGDDYDQLPESVIIFICTFDYFGKKLPFYVFENRCEAMPELLLGDATKKIFVNPYGNRDGLPDDVVNFLDYIRDRKAEDAFTRELEQAVDRASTPSKN
ncbi:MAG: Rpn family recombination-promoting nuclease/putative transposase [Agathobacter sp.]|nr:Rpn family recombination-promoting nuclease/putative transposase [Agathobacter sp.]